MDTSKWNLLDAKEPSTLADGQEVKLQICRAYHNPRDDGSAFFNIMSMVVDDPYANIIKTFLEVPIEIEGKTTGALLNKYMFEMRTFLEAHGIDPVNPGGPTEWIGKTANAIVSLTSDRGGKEENRVKQWVMSE